MRRVLFATSILFFLALFLWPRKKLFKSSLDMPATGSIVSTHLNKSSPTGNAYLSPVSKIKKDNSLESLKNDPNDLAALQSVLELFDFEKNQDRKIQIETDLREISKSCKNCFDLKLLAGETALKNAHFESARDVFREILQEDSGNQAAKRKLIEATTKLREFDEAALILESLIEDRIAEIARLAALGESTQIHEKFLAEDRKEYFRLQKQLN